MGAPSRSSLKVRHYEADPYGHVNHANYVHYLEAARVEALEEVGLPLEEMRRLGYLIVVTDLSVRFFAPARAGDTLEILTHVREIQGARSRWVQHVRSADQRALVTADVPLAGQPSRMTGHGTKADFIGGTTYLMTFPDRGIVVAVMSNTAFADARSIALKIAEAFAAAGSSGE